MIRLNTKDIPIVADNNATTEVADGISRAELLQPMSIFSWTPKPSPSIENITNLRYETTFQDVHNKNHFEVKQQQYDDVIYILMYYMMCLY